MNGRGGQQHLKGHHKREESMVGIDLCLAKSNSEAPRLREVSTRAGGLTGDERRSNLPEEPDFCITRETGRLHPYGAIFKQRGWSPPPPWYGFMKLEVWGPSGIITLQRDCGADRQYSSIYPASFPSRTVISHSTNTSVDSTGSTVTTTFVVVHTLKRTFLKC